MSRRKLSKIELKLSKKEIIQEINTNLIFNKSLGIKQRKKMMRKSKFSLLGTRRYLMNRGYF